MDIPKLEQLSTALYSYSAVDFNSQFLESISIQDLIQIIEWNNDERVSFRAAWALEHLLLKDHNLLIQHTETISQIFISTTNWSVLRSVSKLLIAITKKNTIKISQQDETLGHILNKAFNLVENSLCPIAVRCNLYDIIFLLSQSDVWLLLELKSRIQLDLEKQATPALKSRGNKVLKKLSKFI